MAPDFGPQLEPLLREACQGRLEPISWFRADWQRGGARTGRSRFHVDNRAGVVDVIVKIPVGPTEYLWNHRLQPNETDRYGITAALFASGTTLGEYDLAWLVIERFPEGPLFALNRPDAVELMADAAARFYRRAASYEIDREPRADNWSELVDRARENLRMNSFDDQQRWTRALKTVRKLISKLQAEWDERVFASSLMWIHGDLHPANAMSRSNRPEDPAMLIDLAEVRVGHWVEDAIYFERQYWVRPELIKGKSVIRAVAEARRARGFPAEDGIDRLADIRRVLLAASAPAFLKSEGHPRLLEANLARLEQSIGRLKL